MPFAEYLATLHASAFDSAARWSAAAFEAAQSDPACFFVIDGSPEALSGFALGRTVVDEAELLTLVVAETARRQGIGRDLVLRFEAAARLRGANAAFLEVSADNLGALALYEHAGWRVVGKRTGYYDGVDALAMRKDL